MRSMQIIEELRTKRTVPILPKQCALETKFLEGTSRVLTFCCVLVRNTLVQGKNHEPIPAQGFLPNG